MFRSGLNDYGGCLQLRLADASRLPQLDDDDIVADPKLDDSIQARRQPWNFGVRQCGMDPVR